MADQEKLFDRSKLPLVGLGHPLGPLRRMGRFEWEKVIMRSKFRQSSVKLVALSASTYATPSTGASVRPGIARLTVVTGLGDSQVRRNLKALERAGLIFMVASGSSYGRGGKGAASEYQLTAPEALAEQYETGRNDGTWDEFDQFDIEALMKYMEHRAPSTGDRPVDKPDHRSPSTGDDERTPVLQERTPVLGDENTGTPVPPKSPRPLQITSPHPGGAVTLGDAHASDEPPIGRISLPIDVAERERIYSEASEYLQGLPDHGQMVMEQIRKANPADKIDVRVYAAATAAGWKQTRTAVRF